MAMHPLYGLKKLQERLGASIRAGKFPTAALIVGPPGVGKQRLALWLAGVLFCERQTGSPCGTCQPCFQVSGLTHPDLHWFVPFPPSKKRSGDAEKQIADAADAIGEIVQERREKPLYGPAEPNASHPIASTRLFQRRALMRPFQGSKKIFILGNAERLVVQESSQEAANALLKLLEEPPAGTYILLTTSSPQSLLPTIRSRLVPIRVPSLSEEDVAQFAVEQMGISKREAQKRAEGSAGSIGKLIDTRSGEEKASAAADRLLKAIKRGPTQWTAHALSQPPWGARADFTEMLDAAALKLRRQVAQQAETGDEGVDRPLKAMQVIQEIREAALRNVNPQLGLALLAQRLGEI